MRAGPRHKASPATLPRRSLIAHTAGAVVTALVLACGPFAKVTSVPGGFFEDSDAQFHARRVVRTIQQGALLPPVLDPSENFPEGGTAVWAPLHDASLGLLARLGGSSAADPKRGLTTAAVFPALEFALAALVAALLATRIAGPGGAVAGWLVALTPALLRRGSFGELDHNMTEVVLALALAVVAGLLPDARSAGRSALSAGIWCAAVLVALGFFPGLVIAAALVAAGVVAADLLEGGERSGSIAAGFAMAAVLLPPLASLRVAPDPGDPWRLGPVFALIHAGAAVAISSVVLVTRRGRLQLSRDALPGLALLAGLTVWLLAGGRTWEGFVQGSSFFGARDPWLAAIAEFQPLCDSWDQMTRGFPAVPVAIVGLVVASRGLLAVRGVLVVLTPFVLYLGLALVQRRYLGAAAAFAAVAGGILWARASSRARFAMLAAFVLALLAGGSPLLTNLNAYARGGRQSAPGPIDIAAEAVQRFTPEPGAIPEWGVLAPWGFGHEILWRSGRAVAVDNFGSAHPGFRRALRIYLDPSPAHALAELRALRLRYVVTVRPPLHVPASAAVIGDDPARFYDGVEPRTLLAAGAARRPADLSLFLRLHEHDARPRPGERTLDREALDRFHLIWQSGQTYRNHDGRSIPFIKLFEVR